MLTLHPTQVLHLGELDLSCPHLLVLGSSYGICLLVLVILDTEDARDPYAVVLAHHPDIRVVDVRLRLQRIRCVLGGACLCTIEEKCGSEESDAASAGQARTSVTPVPRLMAWN